MSVNGLLLSGVTGVGKSAMADAVGRVLSAGVGTVAVVDTDSLAQFGPPPRTRPADAPGSFHDALKCRNLAAIWANFKDAGAEFVVVAGGIDSPALRDRYIDALSGCAAVQTVRLVASQATIEERLRRRDDGGRLERNLLSLAEQGARLDAAALEDFTVVNDRSPAEVAHEIVVRAGWLSRA